jgi:anaerobic magnesium-protoporphyrin IX monomethyl ester cyclase
MVEQMKILIIAFRYNKNSSYKYDNNSIDKNYNYYMPIGMASISASLKANGFNVDVLNLNHIGGKIKDILQNKMIDVHYDAVFLGGLSFHYPNIKDIIKYIREISPDTKIIIGGGLISAQPEIMFKLLQPDFVIIGEGEQTSIDLIKCIENNGSLQDVEGIGYCSNNKICNATSKIIFTNPREVITNLDTLPFPDFDAFGMNEFLDNMKSSFIYDAFDYPRAYPILASRSCPFNCTFCFHTVGKKYRQRSLDNVMEEVIIATFKYKINIFFFYDELFAYDKKRALEFCKRFKAFTDTIPWKIQCTMDLRVDCLDNDIINALKNAGCNPVGLGLESYSQCILNSMHKHITPNQIKNAIINLNTNCLAAKGNFIFGDTLETLETAQETLNFFNNYQDILHGIRVTFIIPLQGSEIYNNCVKNGIIKDEIEFIKNRSINGYDFHEPMNLTNMSKENFEILKDRVFTAHYTGGTYIVPLAAKNNNIIIKCPYCKSVSTYLNMDPFPLFGLTNVGCRICNSRFEIVSKYYWIIIYMIKIFGFMRLYKIKKIIGRYT